MVSMAVGLPMPRRKLVRVQSEPADLAKIRESSEQDQLRPR